MKQDEMLKISGFTAHNLKEIVNEGMEKKDRSIHIFFGPAGTSVYINPWQEEKELDISELRDARVKLGDLAMTLECDGHQCVAMQILSAIGNIDKFLKEYGDE